VKWNTAYLSVGSNIGEAIDNCRSGIVSLALNGIELGSVSRFYLTEPMGYADQPWFINGVFQISTELEPVSLLKRLKQAERECGRVDTGIRFGPRVIDFDILLYADIVMDTAELILPHPRMHQRRFVLQPLCDIAPELAHPVLGISMRRLLDALPPDEQQCLPVRED